MAASSRKPRTPPPGPPAPSRARVGPGRLILGCEVLESRLLLAKLAGVPAPRSPRTGLEATSSATAAETASASAAKAKATAITSTAWSVSGVTVRGREDGAKGLALEGSTRVPRTTAAAEKVPATGDTRIVGTLDPDHDTRIYAVPVQPEVKSVRVDLTVTDPGTKPAAQLWLMDGLGRVVAAVALPPAGGGLSLVVEAKSPSSAAGSELFVGVSRGDLGSGDATADPGDLSSSTFILRIGRDAGEPPVETSPGADPQVGLPYAPGTGTAQGIPLSGRGDAGVGDDSAGPLPTRSAGPSAGVLADGQPIPPVGRGEAAVIDLALLDLVAGDSDRRRPGVPSGPDGLIEIRSPGGFPLLGVALAAPDPGRAATRDDAGLAPRNAIPPADPAPMSLAWSRPESPTRPGWPHGRRAPLALGLGLATALAATLCLPGLAGRPRRRTRQDPRR